MKVFLREDSLRMLKEEDEKKFILPDVIYKPLKEHRTSLGPNPAFPSERKYHFDYAVTKDRYREIMSQFDNMTPEAARNELSELMRKCVEKENPIRNHLENICVNAVNKIFAIPKETVNMDCKLVGKVCPDKGLRLMPEDDGKEYSFYDVDDMDKADMAVFKRRLINSLIQGAAYESERLTDTYYPDVSEIDPELPEMYERIISLGDYLLFNEEVKYKEKDINVGAYVGVRLGKNGKKTEIKSQAVILPYLRGFYELFSSSGFPSDREKTKYIIKHSDFLLAEQWDLRMGVGLWRMVSEGVDDRNKFPYLFNRICKLPVSEFNKTLKNIFAGTILGQELKDEIMQNVDSDREYQQFKNDINAKNIEHSLITDGYFGPDEL